MEKVKIITGTMAIEAEGDGAMSQAMEYLKEIASRSYMLRKYSRVSTDAAKAQHRCTSLRLLLRTLQMQQSVTTSKWS